MIIKTDLEFNRVTETEILNSISEAFNSLGYNLRTCNDERREEVIKKKASQMKETINSYIDWHVERPTNAKMQALSLGPGKELSQKT